jgi:hypothetical protein
VGCRQRGQVPYWQIVGQHFVEIVSIEFVRVSNQGWDIYQVQQREWRSSVPYRDGRRR